MGDPGNPTDPSGTPGPGPEPDPEQPGWASPTPPTEPGPPPAPAPAPTPAPPAWPPASPPAPPPGGTVPPPPPGTAVPATGGWGGATPPKKRSLVWLWLLIPTLVVLVASVVVAVVFAVRLFVGPIEATNDYFDALQDGRYLTAYDMRCQSFRSQVSESQFVNTERAAGPVRDFDFNDFESHGDTAETDGTVERSGLRYDVRVHLAREDGDWKVCRIDVRR